MWSWTPANDADAIRREAGRYCPELPFAVETASVFECPSGWYEDYRFVRLSWAHDGDVPVTDVYAFYALGDFRPLDATGRTIAYLNKLGPLRLTPETTAGYVALRLTLELPAIRLTAKLVTEGGLGFAAAQTLVREFGLPAADAALDEYQALSPEARAAWDAARWESAAETSAPATTPLPVDVIDRPPIAFLDERQLPQAVRAALNAPSGVTIHSPTGTTVPTGDAERAPTEPGRTNRYELWLLGRAEHEGFEAQRIVVEIDEGGEFRIVRHAVARLEHDGLDAVVPAARIVCPRRTAAALIDAVWTRLDDDSQAWLRQELEFFDVRVDAAVFRETRLPFYRHYRLLEILVPQRRDYRRTYALLAAGEDIAPLNGTSVVVHRINAKTGELTVDDTTANTYLRFFCWAVHGEAGPFNIPTSFRELPLEALPTPVQQSALRALELGVRPVSDEEAARLEYPPASPATLRRKAHLTYAGAVFEAWFLVQTTGMVQMQHDEPRAADLAIRKEAYGGDDLFVLKAFVEIKGPRPTVQHYHHAEAAPPAEPPPQDRVVAARELVQQLAANGSATDVVVEGAVVLSSAAFRE